MKFRKNEEVIVQIETFGKIVSVIGDRIDVRIGKTNYTLGPEKVKKIVPGKEEQENSVTNFPKSNSEKYIKHLESELMAQRQTADAYREKYNQLLLENKQLHDDNAELVRELESEAKL